MALERSNWVNESAENKKTKTVDNKDKFLKDFCEKQMKDESNKINFLDSIFNAKTISWELKKALEEELSWGKTISSILDDKWNKSVIDKYEWVKIDDISLSDLKSKLLWEYIPLKSKRDNLKMILESEFDLSDKNINKDIDYLINTLKITDLVWLINLFSSRKSFIEWTNLNITEKEKNLADFLKFDTKDLDQDAIKAIDRVQSKFIKWKNITSDDISLLFNELQLSNEDKRKLVHSFIPTITLEEAVKWGIKTKEEADKYKNTLLDIFWVDESDREKCFSSIKDKDIILSTKLHAWLDYQIDTILRKSDFNNVSDYFNTIIESNKEKIKSDWPKNVKDVISELKNIDNWSGRFENINKLEEWNIMKLTKKWESWEDIIQYVKILKADDDKKELTFLKVGFWDNINLNLDWEWDTISYIEFVDNFKKSKTNLSFFEIKDIEKIINDPTKEELNDSDLKLFTSEDLENEEDRKKYKEYYLNKLREELKELEDEFNKEGWKKEDNPLLYAKIQEKRDYLNWVDINYDLDNNKLLDFLNFRKFVDKINQIDPSWEKIWFEKWIFFESKWNIYEVTWTENNKISLNSISWPEFWIDLETFYQIFKKNKAKRLEAIKDFNEIIDNKKDDNKKWDKHEVVDWKLIAKGVEYLEKTENKTVDFLVSDKNNELIKINSIVWNQVTVQFWNRKDYSDLDKSEKKKDKISDDDEWEKIYLDSNEYTLSLNELDKYIDEHELYPNWKTGKKIEPEQPKDLQNKYWSKFSTRLFNRTSINEIIAWWEIFIEWFKESIKTWNDIHAAKVALAMWSILPEEIRADLQIKVERAEAEEMDKALEWLGKVDSPIATRRIKEWLLNKDTPEYKKEAWIMFMLDKYGHLTAKWPLYPFRWKFLWYEALGWRINDKLFLSIKEEAEASNITFSEEYLVHILLKRQCWGGLPPKRRSRLHKEYEAKWKNWIREEFDKGYWDAEKKRTAADMVKWGNDEATWWTTSNAIGWYKKAIERWDSLEKMSEWFFALLYSWALYDVDQATFLKIKGLWDWDKMPIIMTRFSSYKWDMELFNETVLELAKKMENLYPQHKWILWEAQELFNDAKNWNWKEKDRFNRAIDFWKKYWTPLSRALNFSNTDDKTYSETDKIIFLERDKNPIFSKYYNNVRWFTTEWTFWKDFMDDACWQVWLTWLNINELTKQYLWVSQNRNFRDEKTWNIVWDEIQKDLLAINEKTFYKDKKKDREAKEEYLLHVLNDLLAWIVAKVGWDYIGTYNNKQMNMWKYFNSIWLNLKEDFIDFSVSDFEEWSKPENRNSESNTKLRKIIWNILDWNTEDISKNDEPSFDDKITNEDPFDEIISSSKKNVDMVTNSNENKKNKRNEDDEYY